jgi:hypothetical protein
VFREHRAFREQPQSQELREIREHLAHREHKERREHKEHQHRQSIRCAIWGYILAKRIYPKSIKHFPGRALKS